MNEKIGYFKTSVSEYIRRTFPEINSIRTKAKDYDLNLSYTMLDHFHVCLSDSDVMASWTRKTKSGEKRFAGFNKFMSYYVEDLSLDELEWLDSACDGYISILEDKFHTLMEERRREDAEVQKWYDKARVEHARFSSNNDRNSVSIGDIKNAIDEFIKNKNW